MQVFKKLSSSTRCFVVAGDYLNYKFFQYMECVTDNGGNSFYLLHREKNRPCIKLSEDAYMQAFDGEELEVDSFLIFFEQNLNDLISQDIDLAENEKYIKIISYLTNLKAKAGSIINKFDPSKVKYELIEMMQLYYRIVRKKEDFEVDYNKQLEVIRCETPRTPLELQQIDQDGFDNITDTLSELNKADEADSLIDSLEEKGVSKHQDIIIIYPNAVKRLEQFGLKKETEKKQNSLSEVRYAILSIKPYKIPGKRFVRQL